MLEKRKANLSCSCWPNTAANGGFYIYELMIIVFIFVDSCLIVCRGHCREGDRDGG